MKPPVAPALQLTVHSAESHWLRKVVVPSDETEEGNLCLETRTLDGRRIARIQVPAEGFSIAQTRDLLALGPVPILMRTEQKSDWALRGELWAVVSEEPTVMILLGVVYRLPFERKYRGRIRWEAKDLLAEVLAGKAEDPGERAARHLMAAPTNEENA